MCYDDDYDPDAPYTNWQGTKYISGEFQPYLPEIAPPEPPYQKPMLMADISPLLESFLKNVKDTFERDDVFFKKLNK